MSTAPRRATPPAVLFQSASVRVRDYRCRAASAAVGAEEAAQDDEFVLMRSGAFVKHVRGEALLADVNHALFFNRDEPYRVSHPVCTNDRCSIFTLAPVLLREIAARHDPAALDASGSIFRATHVPSTAAIHLLHRRLITSLEHGAIGGVEAEELVFELVDAALASAAPRRARRTAARRSTAIAHRELVEQARVLLARQYTQRLVLDDVARAVHCSPYHLSRLFKRETGVALHRYLNRLRLRHALEALADERRDLTTIALQAGFADHSHFSNAFRREFGLAPSLARRRASARELRQTSKNLQA